MDAKSANIIIKGGEIDQMEIAVLTREKFNNMKLKPGQAKWVYQRALKLAEEFNDMASVGTLVAFWSRDNVVKAVERGDAAEVRHWLGSKVWLMNNQGIGDQ